MYVLLPLLNLFDSLSLLWSSNGLLLDSSTMLRLCQFLLIMKRMIKLNRIDKEIDFVIGTQARYVSNLYIVLHLISQRKVGVYIAVSADFVNL